MATTLSLADVVGGGPSSLALPSVAGRTGGPGGLLGFVDNLWDNARSLVGGFSGLLGAGLHDIGVLGAKVIPGEQSIEQNGFMLDDIAKQIGPAFVHDLATRWGPLFHGDLGQFAHELYTQPLSFGLDALSVVGGLGTVARAGEGAGLAGRIATSLGAPTEDIAKGVSLIRAARAASVTGEVPAEVLAATSGLTDVATLSDLAKTQPLFTRFAERFSPADKVIGARNPMVYEGGPNPLSILKASKNPLVSYLSNKVSGRLFEDSFANVQKDLEAMQLAKDSGATVDEALLKAKQAQLSTLKNAGALSVQTPLYESLKFKKAIGVMLGQHLGDYVTEKADMLKGLHGALSGLSEDQQGMFHALAMGTEQGDLMNLPIDQLTQMATDAGFKDLTDAAWSTVTKDGRDAALTQDAKASLWRMSADGMIELPGADTYRPPPELVGQPNRTQFEGQLRGAMDQANVPTLHQDAAMMFHDSIAQALSQNMPERFPTADSVFKDVSVRSVEHTLEQQMSDVALPDATIKFGRDFGALIDFYKTGDLTSAIETGGNFLRHHLPDEIQSTLHGVYAKGDEAAGGGLAVKTWTAAMDHSFAQDVQRYIFKGILPEIDGTYHPIFRGIRQSIADLWRKVRGIAGSHKLIPDETVNILDDYLGGFIEKVNPAVPQVWEGASRRMRALPVSSLNESLPPAESVVQVPMETSTARQLAVAGRTTYRTQIYKALGIGIGDVFDRIKSPERLAQAAEKLGGATPTDVLGFRAVLDNWQSVDGAVSKLQQDFNVLGVSDTRAVADEAGVRGVTLKVQAKQALENLPQGMTDPQQVFEVQLGTGLSHAKAEASSVAAKSISDYRYTLGKLTDEEGALINTLSSEEGIQTVIDQGLFSSPKAIEERLQQVQEQSNAVSAEINAGNLRMQEMWGSVGDEIGAHQAGEVIPDSAARAAFDQTRTWIWKHREEPWLRSGGATHQYLFERNYLTQMLADGGTWDETTHSIQGSRSAYELDRIRAAKGIPAPMYFPFIDPEQLRYSDFVLSRRPTMGMRKRAADPGMKAATGALYKTGDFVKDPFVAYSHRGATMLRYLDTQQLVADIARKFGRPIQGAQDLQAGEAVFAPDYMTRYFSTKIGLEDRFLSLAYKLKKVLGEDAPTSERLAREDVANIITEGYAGVYGKHGVDTGSLFQAVMEQMPKTQRSILGVTRQGVDLYAIPQVVKKGIEDSVMRQFGSKARIFWDKPTDFWRQTILHLSPRWVVNNLVGNTIMAKLQGAKLTDVIRQAFDPEYRRLLDDLIKEGNIPAADMGFFSTRNQYTAKAGAAVDESVTAGRVQRLAESKVGSAVSTGYGAAKDFLPQVNTALENTYRRSGIIEGVRRQEIAAGVKPTLKLFWTSKNSLERLMIDGVAADGKTLPAALDAMQHAFGNFSQMSQIERQVVRRFIVPFWGFYRHVGQLLISLPIEFPAKTIVLRGLADVNTEMRKQFGDLPAWMDGMVPFGMDSPGTQRFLSTLGPNPFNVVTSSPLSTLHPFLKVALEHLLGQSLLTGRDFTDPNVITPFGSTQQYQVIKDGSGKPIDAIPVDKVTPNILEHLAQQFPQYTMLKDVLAGGRTYDTTTILGLLGGPQTNVPLDANGQPSRPVGGLEQAGRLFGFSTFPFDIGSYQTTLASERAAVLKRALQTFYGTSPTPASSGPLTLASVIG